MRKKDLRRYSRGRNCSLGGSPNGSARSSPLDSISGSSIGPLTPSSRQICNAASQVEEHGRLVLIKNLREFFIAKFQKSKGIKFWILINDWIFRISTRVSNYHYYTQPVDPEVLAAATRRVRTSIDDKV